MIKIPTPSKEIIEEYLEKWKHLEEHYIWQESSLDKLFHNVYKNNTDLNEILIKCSTLNDFYSTNIFSVYSVAKKIYELNIDERLKKGDVTLISDIANIEISGKKKNFYSFASKYCSYHNSNDYPIYDYFVDSMLWYFQKKDKFSDFKRVQLKDYKIFKKVIVDFKEYYNLKEYSFRDIDKYLWIAGKEYLKKM